MANLAVEANILAALPPGVVSAVWLDLSDQLGEKFKPETSRLVRAVAGKGEVIFYAAHETNDKKPFFLEITLPEGTTTDEGSGSGVLLPDVVLALNSLASLQ